MGKRNYFFGNGGDRVAQFHQQKKMYVIFGVDLVWGLGDIQSHLGY